MTAETQILTEVEALKGQFSDTKTLYREVCALLFFRYGITPTTNKLYQYVRRGSMSAPAEALTKFWDELRSKARIEIDHPDLPEDVKQATAAAIATIWRQATTAARDELSALREEVSGHLVTAQDERSAAVRQSEELRQAIADLQAQLQAALGAVAAADTEMESERRAHAATAARHLEVQRTCDDLRTQLDRQRADFSADLAKARDAVDTANARADASDRRALLEIEQERQAKARQEKQSESLRVQLANLETKFREAETSAATAQSTLRASLQAAEHAATVAAIARDSLQKEAMQARSEATLAREDAIRAQAEAQAVKALFDRLAAGAADTVAEPAGGSSPRAPKKRP